ncbi:acyltransferase [Pseudomonas sp. GL-B-19]|uniref:acyltransferase n=1 Tax=Pseudomonas sp. GL-B-19 TaxID=2832393 RepID=UPI001CBDF668|nr:acyltransferase [Pseudomonas sp. GL-B-19]
MTVLTKIGHYQDDKGNVILSSSTFNSGIKVVFKGNNNKLEIHREAVPSNVVVLFDCDNGTCIIGKNHFSGTIRVGLDCNVKIGAGVTCTSPAYISTAERSSVSIGNDVMIAGAVEIRSDDGHPIFDVVSRKRINFPKDIVVKNHVWLGASSKILGGTVLKEGCVVGIGSIVKGRFPNNCVVAGVPAKVVRRNIAWERPHLTLAPPFYKEDPDAIPLTPYWNLTVDDDPESDAG